MKFEIVLFISCLFALSFQHPIADENDKPLEDDIVSDNQIDNNEIQNFFANQIKIEREAYILSLNEIDKNHEEVFEIETENAAKDEAVEIDENEDSNLVVDPQVETDENIYNINIDNDNNNEEIEEVNKPEDGSSELDLKPNPPQFIDFEGLFEQEDKSDEAKESPIVDTNAQAPIFIWELSREENWNSNSREDKNGEDVNYINNMEMPFKIGDIFQTKIDEAERLRDAQLRFMRQKLLRIENLAISTLQLVVVLSLFLLVCHFLIFLTGASERVRFFYFKPNFHKRCESAKRPLIDV